MIADSVVSNNVKRMGALVVLLMALIAAGLTCVPGLAQAEGEGDQFTPIAVVRVGNENYNCDKFSDVMSAMLALRGKQAVVEMARDWDKSVEMADALVIPENARVTLNMNGHKIDRELTSSGSWEGGGEVILVMSGAMLTINGGSGANSHTAYVYQSARADDGPVQTTIQGALITGGASTNTAGGIQVNKGATVTLNNVTVAGCRSQKAGGSNGNGGGMNLVGGSITVNLNNSTITGCYAHGNGGGIYGDNAGAAAINLSNSHIDYNYASGYGGGIEADGKGTRIAGDVTPTDAGATGVSTISHNSCNWSGGGVCVGNCDMAISRLAIEDNTSGTNGGGVYARRDRVMLDRLVIGNNSSSLDGGGVYFSVEGASANTYDGPSEIADCTITGNHTASSYGGGVYCDDYSFEPGATKLKERERRISGETVIWNNTAGNNRIDSNLCIRSNGWRNKNETFYLTEGAKVGVFYVEAGAASRPSLAKDKSCAKYLHSDQAGFAFVFGIEERYITRVLDRDIPDAVEVFVSPSDAYGAYSKVGDRNGKAGKIGTVGAGGVDGDDYDLIRGFFMHDGEGTLSAFYYSDGLFYGDPKKYNEHLGTLSWAWTLSASYLNKDESPVDGNVYYNKHAGGRQLLADIGCPDQNIYINDFMTQKPGTDSIGVTIGHKELAKADGTKTGDILVPIAIRSQGYEAEWVSNVTLGSAAQMSPTKEAMGFASAANQAFAEVELYLKKYDLEDEYMAGKVKFWVAGYSRGGATANLTSKRLVDKIAKDGCKSQVFGYTCEGAKGGTDDAEVAGNDYTCIHNMVNLVDVVPYVAPVEMGFKRYGVDHYVPGSEADKITPTKESVARGGSGGPKTVTTYADNKAYFTKTPDYKNQRNLMRPQLLALNPDMVLNDSFQPQAMDFISTSGFLHVYDEGREADNHIEDFVPDFLWLLQEQAATSRDEYAIKAYSLNGTTYPTIQSALQQTIYSVMGGGMSGFIDKAGNIKDNISTVSIWRFLPTSPNSIISFDTIDFSMAGLYFDVIGEWKKKSESEKAAWTRNLWNALVKTGGVDKLSAEDKANLESNFPTLLNMALNIVDVDYNYKPKNNSVRQWAKGSDESMMYLPTFMTYSDYILSCHTPDINIAWVRSYDDWYKNDKNEYTLDAQAYSVEPPKAFAIVDGKQEELKKQSGGANDLVGSQRITLENVDIVGEAVYYDLKDVTDGAHETVATNRIYRGGIDLPLESGTAKSYEITTYDMSYGRKSGSVTYRVNLSDGKHKVVVHDLAPSDSDLSGQSSVSPQGVGSGDDGLGLMAGSVSGGLLQTASDPGVERTREFIYSEDSKVLVEAGLPSARYFKTWMVELFGADGTKVEDVTEKLLPGDAKNDEDAIFTMPKVDGTAYKQGYELRLTADYGSKITDIKLNPTAPNTGNPLQTSVPASFVPADAHAGEGSFEPAWSYRAEDGSIVPASGVASAETVYYAQILIEQDPGHDIVFDASSVNVGLADGLEPDVVEIREVTRNAEEGTITVVLGFAKTGAGPKPDPGPLQFEVIAYDMNTGQRILDPVKYSRGRKGDSVQVVAPYVKDMAFTKWDFTTFDRDVVVPSSDLTQRRISFVLPDKDELSPSTIIAYYMPAISAVDVNLYDANNEILEPEAGGTGPARAEMLIAAGSDVYEVNPASLSVAWSPELPEGARFAPMAQYLGSVSVNVKTGEGGKQVISARKQGSEDDYRDIDIAAVPADNFVARFNGEEKDVNVDFAEHAVSKMFQTNSYVLESVKQPDNITDVPYAKGQTALQVKVLLPKTTRILTKHGIELDADIAWGNPTIKGGGDVYDAKVWAVSGKVKLPDTVENGDKVSLDVSVTVSVNDAGTARAPVALLPSGEYLYNQETKLDTQGEAGKTFYTTDGSDPRESATAKEYNEGDAIYIDRKAANLVETRTGKKELVIKAYTTGTEQRDSEVATYEYVFSDIPVPQGATLEYNNRQQIGIYWGAFYTLEAVDEAGNPKAVIVDGNAAGTDPGVYRVKAKLDPESGAERWATDDEQGWSKDDQIVQFVITGKKDGKCTVAVYPDPSDAGAATVSLKGEDASSAGAGITVDEGTEVTIRATANNGYAFVDWRANSSDHDIEVSTDPEHSFKVTDASLLSAQFEQACTVRWLNGDGSVLDSATFRKGDPEPTTDKVPTKAADAQYTYTFSNWDDGTWDKAKTVKTYEPQFTTTTNTYKVTFVDEDGTVLKGATAYDYGTKAADIAKPADPAKASDAQYTYAFAGWNPALADVTADATYRATYSKTLNKYRVDFVNDDGTVLQTGQVGYGAVPSYKGDVPKKAATETVSYVFTGWAPDIVEVTGNAVYTAVYDEVPVSNPVKKASLVFDPAGGKIDGKTSLVIVAEVGDVVEIPKAPVRDGYAFKYWMGSRYYPGDEYTVKGDHTFTAVWEKKSASNQGQKPSTRPAPAAKNTVSKTGDAVPAGTIAALSCLAIVALVVSAIAVNRRKRVR